jgi:hypothetical protein
VLEQRVREVVEHCSERNEQGVEVPGSLRFRDPWGDNIEVVD